MTSAAEKRFENERVEKSEMESPPNPSSSSFNPADYCARGLLTFCDPATTPSYPEPPSPVFAAADSPAGNTVSPLIIGLTTVLFAAVFLVSCYIAYIYYKRHRWSQNQEEDDAASLAPPSPDSNGGLDEQYINSLTVFKYRGDGLVGLSTDCAVCLTEFIEDESLRLMTNCQHAFHPPCIDTWLRSRSNCPTCRASIV